MFNNWGDVYISLEECSITNIDGVEFQIHKNQPILVLEKASIPMHGEIPKLTFYVFSSINTVIHIPDSISYEEKDNMFNESSLIMLGEFDGPELFKAIKVSRYILYTR